MIPGCPCAECRRNKPAKIPSVHKIRAAATNALVHDRDRLQDRVEELERQLVARSVRGNVVEYLCDRCPAVVSVVSSAALNDEATCQALTALAFGSGWNVPDAGPHLCPACALAPAVP